jgi:GT2 family glycosyltransferase
MIFSVIIPVKDDPRLFDLLNQLVQDNDSDKFEVAVSCNGSSQDFVSRVEQAVAPLPHSQVLFSDIPGPSRALNFASSKISTDKFLILDSDCILEDHFIANLLAGMKDHKIVRGHVVYRGSNWFSRLTSDWRQSINNLIEQEGRIYTPNLMVDKSLFEQLGKFSDTMRFSYDSNFSDHAMNLGYSAHIIPDAIIYHDCHDKIKTEIKIWKSYGRGRYNRMTTHWNNMSCFGRIKKAIFGDLAWDVMRRDAAHFLYGLCYFFIRLVGFLQGPFIPPTKMG